MTKKQIAYKKVLLKKVHLTKRYSQIYKYDRELWEEFLKNNYSVTSSKELSIDELKNLIDVLNEKDEIKIKKATINQINYILYLWQERSIHKDIFSLLKFVKKTLKKDVESLEELSHKEAGILIRMIRKIEKLTPINNI